MTKIIFLLALATVVVFVGYSLMGSEQPKENNLLEPKITEGQLTPVTITLGTLVLVTERSVIEWEGRKKFIPGYVDTGTMRVKSGSVFAKDGEARDGVFTIDMTSIAAGSTGKGGGETMLTKHLKSPDFFNVASYPTAIFSFKKIAPRVTPMTYDVVGDLTVKNKTNEIAFLATIGEDSAGLVKLQATLELDRTLWDIRYGSGKFFDNLGDKMIEDMFGLKLSLVFKEE